MITFYFEVCCPRNPAPEVRQGRFTLTVVLPKEAAEMTSKLFRPLQRKGVPSASPGKRKKEKQHPERVPSNKDRRTYAGVLRFTRALWPDVVEFHWSQNLRRETKPDLLKKAQPGCGLDTSLASDLLGRCVSHQPTKS